MSDYTVIGQGVVLESNLPVIDPNEGLFWKQVYVGPQNLLYTQRDILNVQPDERVSFAQRNGPTYEMTIITPDYRDGQSSALNKYELINHEVEKSIMDHRRALAMTDPMRWEVRNWIKNNLTPDYFSSPDEAVIYSKMLLGSGAAKCLSFERTFRYSIVTSARYGILASEAHVGELWTAAQIIDPSKSGIIFPPTTRFDLAVVDANAPGTVTKNIRNPNTHGYPDPLQEIYRWTWLKMGNEVETLPSGKVRINQAWLGDMWSCWENDLAFP